MTSRDVLIIGAGREGFPSSANFFFLGRLWQRSHSSALITGAGNDVAWIRD